MMQLSKYKNVEGKWKFWYKRKITKFPFKNAEGLILGWLFPDGSREHTFIDKKGFLNTVKISKA